jgi:hypothetical protein
MKKLLLILAAFACLTAFGQRTITSNTLNAGASDTTSYEVGTTNDNFFGGTWSYQLNYKGFDDVDATISLYYGNFHPDSACHELLFFDENADGTNDNPWTLSDTANGDFVVHGEYFPAVYFYRVLTRGSVSDSTTAYEKIVKQ